MEASRRVERRGEAANKVVFASTPEAPRSMNTKMADRFLRKGPGHALARLGE